MLCTVIVVTGLCDLVKTVVDKINHSSEVPNYQIISPIVLLLSAVSAHIATVWPPTHYKRIFVVFMYMCLCMYMYTSYQITLICLRAVMLNIINSCVNVY